MPEAKKSETLPEHLASINKHAAELKRFGKEFGAVNSSFATTDYANEIKAFKANLEAKVNASALPAAQKEALMTQVTDLESKVQTQYNSAVRGDAPLDEKELKASFAPLATALSALPDFKSEHETLERLQDNKLENAAKALARNLEGQHTTNFSKHASYVIAKNLGFKSDNLFVEQFGLDEEKLDKEMKGIDSSIATIRTADAGDGDFRKKVKRLIESDKKFFISAKYPGIIFEKTKDGAWWPKPPLKDADYPRAYEGTVSRARIQNPNAVLILSIHRISDSAPHPIKTAGDVERKILSVFKIAEAQGARMELDDETRSQILYLMQQAGKGSKMEKVGNAVFEIELGMLEKIKKLEMVGKNAEEWARKTQEAESKLVVPGSTPLAPGGAGDNTYANKAVAAEALLTADPTVGFAAKTEAEQKELIVRQLVKTEIQNDGNKRFAIQIRELKNHLNELATRIDAAKDATILMDGQLSEMKFAATAQPDADALQNNEHGQIKKLEALQATNQTYLEDLQLRAEVYKEALRDIPPESAAIMAEKETLTAKVNAQMASIGTLQISNNDATRIPGSIQGYIQHQATKAQEQQQQQARRLGS